MTPSDTSPPMIAANTSRTRYCLLRISVPGSTGAASTSLMPESLGSARLGLGRALRNHVLPDRTEARLRSRRRRRARRFLRGSPQGRVGVGRTAPGRSRGRRPRSTARARRGERSNGRSTVCSPACVSRRRRIKRMPGVWPAVLQKRTKYAPAVRIQPPESSAPTSHSGRRPPMSDATIATTPTTAMNMAVVTITSAASAIARDAMPAKAERPTCLRRATACSMRSSSRTAVARAPPTTSSASPAVCFLIASRISGLDATCRRACCVSSLASTRSVSSSVRGLASATLTRRSSSPLAAS